MKTKTFMGCLLGLLALASLPATANTVALVQNGESAYCYRQYQIHDWNRGYVLYSPYAEIEGQDLVISLFAKFLVCGTNAQGDVGFVEGPPQPGTVLVAWQYFLFSTGKFSSPFIDSTPSATSLRLPLRSILTDSEREQMSEGRSVEVKLQLFVSNTQSQDIDESRSSGNYIMTVDLTQQQARVRQFSLK